MNILIIIQQNGKEKIIGPLISIKTVKNVLELLVNKLITLGEVKEMLIEEGGLLCSTC